MTCVLCFSYQFVVKDDGDYSIHSVDPDVLVDWDAIELIVCVFVNQIHNLRSRGKFCIKC